MGLHNRDYYRGDEPRGIEFGGQWMMVTTLVVINVAIFVASIFTGQNAQGDTWLMDKLAAKPSSLVSPLYWWQLVTYGFAHDTRGMMHILFNMFGLWMFGRDVEGVYGRKEFLRIYLVALFLGGLFWTARVCLTVESEDWVGYSVVGASGAVTAVILLFCVHFPKRTVLLMFVLPAPAWVLGLLIIVGNFYEMSKEGNVAVDVHLVGAVFAICYYRFRWNMGYWTSAFSGQAQWLKRKPRLRIHDPGGSRDLDTEADRILDKVNRNGIESLNAKERRILEEYSRRMRQKHQ